MKFIKRYRLFESQKLITAVCDSNLNWWNLDKMTDEQLRKYWKQDLASIILMNSDKNGLIKPGLMRCLDVCDINAKCKKDFNRVALIMALHLGNKRLVKELLKRGALIDIKDGYGDDPIDVKLHQDFWDDAEVQDLVLTYQPQNYKLLNKNHKIHQSVKDNHKDLFGAIDFGLLENNIVSGNKFVIGNLYNCATSSREDDYSETIVYVYIGSTKVPERFSFRFIKFNGIYRHEIWTIYARDYTKMIDINLTIEDYLRDNFNETKHLISFLEDVKEQYSGLENLKPTKTIYSATKNIIVNFLERLKKDKYVKSVIDVTDMGLLEKSTLHVAGKSDFIYDGEFVLGYVLLDACSRGDLNRVKDLISKNKDLVNYRNNDWTPILKAAKGNFIKVVEYLLENGAEIKSEDPITTFADSYYFSRFIFNRYKDKDKLFKIQKRLIEANPIVYNILKKEDKLHPDIEKEFPDLINVFDLGLLEKFSIRDKYQEFGPQEYYKKFGNEYVNPHENQIREAIKYVNKNWKVDFNNVLDLCAGSGEITKILLELGYNNIDAIDPYTSELYQKTTGKKCEKFTFDDIYKGVLEGRHYSTIVCSFSLHLVESSKLPILCYRLSEICDNLLILTPHKRPEIKSEWGFDKTDEKLMDRVRVRLYES